MPQLDTSTWFTTMLASIITLFIIFQLKLSLQVFPNPITTKTTKPLKIKNLWEPKWTKTYLPLSLPLQ
uniref:ATP synthase complex subunit 8 n=1 Tax=Gerbilliscus leucogaster TaxID=410302 RepID=A0A4D6DIJ2_9RODE|nr:ATP synthase F0 subunit 8 [Gerbilliscus leucogaster]QBZ37951.1 ATP synthase F0 subunit 8 [Gerbilliscus leucogaster]